MIDENRQLTRVGILLAQVDDFLAVIRLADTHRFGVSPDVLSVSSPTTKLHLLQSHDVLSYFQYRHREDEDFLTLVELGLVQSRELSFLFLHDSGEQQFTSSEKMFHSGFCANGPTGREHGAG